MKIIIIIYDIIKIKLNVDSVENMFPNFLQIFLYRYLHTYVEISGTQW